MDFESIETEADVQAQEQLLAAKMGKWADNSSWNPLDEDSDAEVCERLLSREVSEAEFAHDFSDPDSPNFSNLKLDTARQGFVARFRVERKIGEGAFGVVFRVYDNRLKRHAAVKILRPSLGSDRKLVRRFVREGQAIAMLRAEGIIQVFDVGRVGSQPYLVMELVDGPSLHRWLVDRKQPLEIRRAVVLIREIAKAVGFAHSRGILHRDLKPSNILLTADYAEDDEQSAPKPILTDFGLAKQLDNEDRTAEDLTVASELIGTIRYMSPEQASGKTAEIATTSDVFSLGVIFYELLTGKLPFEAKSNPDIIQRICHERPTSLRSLRKDIPRDLEAVVSKCLEKQPSARYSNAMELVADLNRYLDGQPVEASNPTLLRRSFSAMRSRPYRTLAIACMVISLVASISLWFTLTARERSQYARAEANLQLALQGIGRMLYEYSGSINDGLPVSHERNLEVLLKSLEVHEKLSSKNPQDRFALHRLAVAHHFVANGYARVADDELTAKHRRSFRDIVEQLAKLEPDNPKYIFDGFMSNFLLASGELQKVGYASDSEEVLTAFAKAEKCIGELTSREPKNVDYADAYNSLRMIQIRNAPEEPRFLALIPIVVESSLALWKKHPERPLLAKPALYALSFNASVDLRNHRLEGARESIDQAYLLMSEAFPVESLDGQLGQQIVDLNLLRAMILLALQDWQASDAAAEEAIHYSHKANEISPMPAVYLFQIYKVRSAANAMMGLNDKAAMYEQEALAYASKAGLDHLQTAVWKWAELVVARDPAAFDALFPR